MRIYIVRESGLRPAEHRRGRGQLVSALILGLGLPALLGACAGRGAAAGPATDAPETLPPVPLPTTVPGQADDARSRFVRIVQVDAGAQVVDLRNEGDETQSLYGWVLAEEGSVDQCWLSGTIAPGDTLRVWAMVRDTGRGGYNCGFGGPVWSAKADGPALVLYDDDGHEVDRRP